MGSISVKKIKSKSFTGENLLGMFMGNSNYVDRSVIPISQYTLFPKKESIFANYKRN